MMEGFGPILLTGYVAPLHCCWTSFGLQKTSCPLIWYHQSMSSWLSFVLPHDSTIPHFPDYYQMNIHVGRHSLDHIHFKYSMWKLGLAFGAMGIHLGNYFSIPLAYKFGTCPCIIITIWLVPLHSHHVLGNTCCHIWWCICISISYFI